MVDKFDVGTRSKIMASIKGKNTSIETLVFRYLRKEHIHFQKHYSRVLGNPDVALPRKKKAVFIDGDFWHGNVFERRKDKLPAYWQDKIIRNMKRDSRYRKQLRADGWQTLRIWEVDLIKKSSQQATLERIKKFLVN